MQGLEPGGGRKVSVEEELEEERKKKYSEWEPSVGFFKSEEVEERESL